RDPEPTLSCPRQLNILLTNPESRIPSHESRIPSPESRVSPFSVPSCELLQFVNLVRKDVVQTSEPRVRVEIRAGVAERTWHVLNIDRIAAGGGLVTEGAERLQIALQGHEIESPSEFLRLIGSRLRGAPALEREEVRDEIVELAIGDVDVGI